MESKGKVCVGISGGIDSAATVLILQQNGYEVIGVNLILSDSYMQDSYCKSLADRLKIKLIRYDVRARFHNSVVIPFIESYLEGDTPSPCVGCNRDIKWLSLKEIAVAEGATKIATGHYCRIVERDGYFFVSTGVDPIKDQSYYLWLLDQKILKDALMPLGDKTKEDIRSYMLEMGFGDLVKKSESMGVCFLEGRGYQSFLRERVPGIESLKGGEIIDQNDCVVGYHDGYPFYTLAQKKGVNIKNGECIVRIDKHNNRLYLGTKDDLFVKKIFLRDWRITDPDSFFSSDSITIKVRGVGENPQERVSVEKYGDLLSVSLSDSAWAVVSGQPAVFYDKDIVVGGGVISVFK